MISLRFPILVWNTPIPIKPKPKPKPKPFASQIQTKNRTNQSGLSLLRLPKFLAASTGRGDGKTVAADPPAGLKLELMPKHVAVIMDGNARWARRRWLPSAAGHQAGVKSLKQLMALCRRWGIKVLTVFAFSADNWIRSTGEVEFLMTLFGEVLKAEIENLKRDGTRVSIIGDSSKLPKSLRNLIRDIEESTKDNTRLQLIIAISYSGKYDVVQACKTISQKVKDGLIPVEDINETLIEQELETNCTEFPYPDLLIRTSGELRVSNFLLWQLAYTELFFAESLWPDFGEAEFIEALVSFQNRQRRYGGRDL